VNTARRAVGPGPFAALAAFAAVLALLAGCAGNPSPPAARTGPAPAPAKASSGASEALPSLTVAAVGDIMLGTDYPQDRLPPQGAGALLRGMADTLRGADIAFANLEGVLLDGGEPVKQCTDPAWCYLFRSPSAYAADLEAAGFDVLSLANNHARDFGEPGRSATMRTLDNVGIRHSGRAGDIASWRVKGVRVALVAFAPFLGSNSMLDRDLARAIVTALKANHDIVMVSVHAGAEGADVTHLSFEREYYHGEDRGDEVAFAHAMVDAGADLVLGSGPHVPRALELYRGRLVAYSLGNFCTYWGIKVAGPNGLAPILTVRLAPDGRFVGGRIVSARQVRPAGPRPDPKRRAARLMAELTREDFPHTALAFQADGRVLAVSPAAAPKTALSRR